jgi:outer membrane protein OmpA-like peptidoglycan-associated protein
MKRIIFTASLMLLAIVSVQAQEKGSYLTISGSLGMNQFRYEMDNGRMGDPRLGYGGALGYQYFWNRHWGLGTGVGIAYYNTKANKYNNSFNNDETHFQFNDRIDDDPIGPIKYDLQLKLSNWQEKQYAYFLEVPLMLCYQTKWGEKQAVGMYWGLGAKAQFPVIYGKYEVGSSSELTIQGYYPAARLTLDDLPLHGYGTAKGPAYKGDLDLKISFAAVGEIGFLVALNRRVDLTLGGYLDVGLNNIKDGNKSESENAYLIEPNTPTHQNKIGEGFDYNGIINSHVTDDVKLLGVGGKIGLRIKLGKLTEKKIAEEPENEEMIVVQEVIKEPEPVVEVQPVMAEGISQADINILSEPIFFDLAKHDLKPDAIQVLDRKVAILKKYPDVKVVVAGNTCDLGGDKINVPLGQRRADAARDYMEKNGINGSRMETITQSSNYPMLPNTNEQNRTKNRRDDFKPSGY